MRLYFAANNQAEEKFQKRFSDIIAILSEAGVLVMSNLVDKNLSGFSNQDLEKFDQAGEVLLEKMDGLIVEGSYALPETGYLFAFALTHKIPILYLTERGRGIDKNLQHLQKDKTTGGLIDLQNYSDKTLSNLVLSFLQKIEGGQGGELPNIKFTLRITPRIERYLYFKTHNTKIAKADFLREKIEQMIDQDEQYQKFIKKD
ncbi:MAG: hypothetical protein WCX71_05040 [Candidatus Buchananbacteria bacterium]